MLLDDFSTLQLHVSGSDLWSHWSSHSKTESRNIEQISVKGKQLKIKRWFSRNQNYASTFSNVVHKYVVCTSRYISTRFRNGNCSQYWNIGLENPKYCREEWRTVQLHLTNFINDEQISIFLDLVKIIINFPPLEMEKLC